MEARKIRRSPVREEEDNDRAPAGVVDWDNVIKTTPENAAVQESHVRGFTSPPRRPSRRGVKIVVSCGGQGE